MKKELKDNHPTLSIRQARQHVLMKALKKLSKNKLHKIKVNEKIGIRRYRE